MVLKYSLFLWVQFGNIKEWFLLWYNCIKKRTILFYIHKCMACFAELVSSTHAFSNLFLKSLGNLRDRVGYHIYGTRHSFIFQISLAYWPIVLSLLNFPLPAVLNMDIFVHLFLSLRAGVQFIRVSNIIK